MSVEWALAHHEEIETAARLRKELATLGQVSTDAFVTNAAISDGTGSRVTGSSAAQRQPMRLT